MRAQAPERAPRLVRAVLLQLALLAAGALASEVPWVKKPAKPPEPQVKVVEQPKPVERRLRVVRLPPPEPAKAVAKAAPKPPAPKAPEPAKPPQENLAEQQPPEPAKPPEPAPAPKIAKSPPPRKLASARPTPPKPQPTPEPQEPKLAEEPKPAEPVRPRPQRVIAADSTAVHGVRLRVLIPSEPAELAAHLRNSGGCMVVSRLAGDGAEVMSLVSLRGGSARLDDGSPCDGVPRLVRDASVNAALGDPLGQARAQHPEDQNDLVLQVLLTPRLHDQAQAALQRRFGAISEEEMGEKAAEAGYELTCFAEPEGNVRCQ
jgi:hypothetical protein